MTAVVFSPQEHAEAILGIVFKEGEPPRRAVASGIGRIGNSRCAAAPDSGTAGCVRNHHTVAKELGNQFGIRRFAAARTGAAGKFEERFEELAAPYGSLHGFGNIFDRKVPCVFPVFPVGFTLAGQRFHDQGLVFGRADADAASTARAVFGRDGHVELEARKTVSWFTDQRIGRILCFVLC